MLFCWFCFCLLSGHTLTVKTLGLCHQPHTSTPLMSNQTESPKTSVSYSNTCVRCTLMVARICRFALIVRQRWTERSIPDGQNSWRDVGYQVMPNRNASIKTGKNYTPFNSARSTSIKRTKFYQSLSWVGPNRQKQIIAPEQLGSTHWLSLRIGVLGSGSCFVFDFWAKERRLSPVLLICYDALT